MAIDRKPIALAWLSRIHRELQPNVTLDVFINSLRMRDYGSELLTDADFQEWLQSKGEIINLSNSVADNVRNAIVVKYSSNKNWIPTRKTIDSAFINLSSTAWSYFDAVKVTTMEVVKVGKIMADATGKLTYAATTSAASLVNITKYLWWPAAAFLIYMVYTNREKFSSLLTEKAVKKLTNPSKRVKRAKARRKAKKQLALAQE